MFVTKEISFDISFLFSASRVSASRFYKFQIPQFQIPQVVFVLPVSLSVMIVCPFGVVAPTEPVCLFVPVTKSNHDR